MKLPKKSDVTVSGSVNVSSTVPNGSSTVWRDSAAMPGVLGEPGEASTASRER